MKLYAVLIGLFTAFITLAKYAIIACIIVALIYNPYGVAHFIGSFIAAVLKPIIHLFL